MSEFKGDFRRSRSSIPRVALKAELSDALTRQAELRERVKIENTRRNFAGLGNSPFYLAARETLDSATLADLETRALSLQDEREQSAAARRAAKTAAAPTKPEPAPPNAMRRNALAAVEVIARRPRPNGGAL